MMNFESIKQGLSRITISYKNRKEYLDSLDQSDKTGNIKELSLVISRAVEQGLNNFIYLVYGHTNLIL